MDSEFQIPIIINGKDLSFNACLVTGGYITKIQVSINGEHIIYEPDEEGQYRALVDPESITENSKISVEILQEIAKTIQSVRQ